MFTNKTIIEVVDKLFPLNFNTHNTIDTYFMGFSLDSCLEPNDSLATKRKKLISYLVNEDNQAKIADIVIDLIERDIERVKKFEWGNFQSLYPHIIRLLNKDGYVIEDDRVGRLIPSTLNNQNNEEYIFYMLDKYGWTTLKGHLEQALENYKNSNWAACNSQLRTFFEGLLDHMADEINSISSSPVALATSNVKRAYLSNINPPILDRNLNEWTDDGKNFINGIFKRLHPAGSHVGLSSELDSTTRIQLVFILGFDYIQRFDTLYR